MSRRAQESSPAETESEAPQPSGQEKAGKTQLTGKMLEEADSRVALNVMSRFAARILKT